MHPGVSAVLLGLAASSRLTALPQPSCHTAASGTRKLGRLCWAAPHWEAHPILQMRNRLGGNNNQALQAARALDDCSLPHRLTLCREGCSGPRGPGVSAELPHPGEGAPWAAVVQVQGPSRVQAAPGPASPPPGPIKLTLPHPEPAGLWLDPVPWETGRAQLKGGGSPSGEGDLRPTPVSWGFPFQRPRASGSGAGGSDTPAMTSSPVSRVVYNGKRNSSPRSPPSSSEIFTPAHEENVRFIYEAWQGVERDLRSQMSGSERGLVEEYVEKVPNPSLKTFKPIDLSDLKRRNTQDAKKS
ncbi:mapk-regulated corepressor-interacting protein 1 isoform X1 [Camelus bactrianus]|uniref:Mapk-regulated corepressor-interacting protein 1 isoform X1 n=9 Tax=Camelidae TaxID=9835 RepID=A0A9W3GPU1_CAMBA|nr:mapk-regulated corepressor-interacting protein 1 isoform X1 [Camelus bactrianus]